MFSIDIQKLLKEGLVTEAIILMAEEIERMQDQLKEAQNEIN